MGFWLSVLTASLGVHQFLAKTIALQWIFAFIIMAILFLATVTVAYPAWTGKDPSVGREEQTDEERAPLISD